MTRSARVRGRVRAIAGRMFVVAALASVLSLAWSPAAYCLSGSQVGLARDAGQDWLRAHQNADGTWGTGASAWRDTQLALQALDSTSGIDTAALESWLASATASNTDFLARKVVIQRELGLDPSDEASSLASSQLEDGGFPLAAAYSSDVWDTQLALEAVVGDDSYGGTCESALEFLASTQNDDGGWSAVDGDVSDVLMTADVVRTIAVARGSRELTPGQQAALVSGRMWLATNLELDGSLAENFLDTANAARALPVSGASYDASAQVGWLLSQAAADGSFGRGDVRDTALAVLALKAADTNVAVTGVTVSNPSPRAGEIVRVSATVANTGSRSVSGLGVAFVNGPVGVAAIAHQTQIPLLAAGATTTVSFNFEVPEADSEIEVSAIANLSGAISEIDDSDNIASATITVRGPLGTPSLLSPDDGAQLATGTPNLSWLESPLDLGDLLGDIVQLDRSPAFDSPQLRTNISDVTAGGTPFLHIAADAPLAEGVWYWRVRTYSGAQASSWTPTRAFKVDTIAPVLRRPACSVTPFSPNSDGVKDVSTLGFELSEDASLSVDVVDGANVTRASDVGVVSGRAGRVEVAWDGSGAPTDGTYRLVVSAVDAAGNVASATSDPVLVDRTAPVLTDLTSDVTTISPNGDGYRDSVNLAWSASTADTVIVQVAGPPGVIRVDQTTGHTYTWNGRTLYNTVAPDGEYTVGVYAQDVAGNTSVTMRRTVALKATVKVGAATVEPDVVAPGAEARVAVPVSDDSSVTITLNGTALSLTDDGSGTHSVVVTAPPTPGNYTISVVATDSLRNVSVQAQSALIVRASEVTGQVWLSDTHAQFRTVDGNTNCTHDGISHLARPGSLQLDTHQWEDLGPMSFPRWGSANCMGPDGKLYCFGGYYSDTVTEFGLHPVPNSSVYDPGTGQWAEVAPSPSGRFDAQAVLAPNGKIYVIGGTPYAGEDGWGIAMCDTVESYDPLTNVWETDTKHGGELAPMPTDRAVFGISLGHDGRIYCIGGFTGVRGDGEACAECEAYDPVANTWESKTSMPQKECCFAATGIDGKIYALEGQYRLESPGSRVVDLLSSAWSYDTLLDSWTQLPASPVARGVTLAAQGRDGLIYVYGGYSDTASGLTYAYNPLSQDWFRSSDMVYGVEESQGLADAEGRVYAFGGVMKAAYAHRTGRDVQRLDPSFDTSGTYTSPVKYLGSFGSFGAVTWHGEVPSGTSMSLATRTSLDGQNWSPWSAEYVASGSSVTSPNGRYIQYRVSMATADGRITPRIDDVAIVYNRSPSTPIAYGAQSATHMPTLRWGPRGDFEGDPVTYDLQVDTSSAFDSTDLRQFDAVGLGAPNFTIPPGQALPDGAYYWRLRASDGRTASDWSQVAEVLVDTKPPVVSIESFDPAVVSVGGDLGSNLHLTCGVDETSTIDVRVDVWKGSYWASISGLASLGGTPGRPGSWVWSGTSSQGAAAAAGQYRVVLSARDGLGNVSAAVTREFRVRIAPRLSSVEPSSDVLDPQGVVSLRTTTTGDATRVQVTAEDATRTLIDSETSPGLFTGAVSRIAPARRVTVDAIAAADGVSGAKDVAGAQLDVPGTFDANALVVTSPSDFALGTIGDSLTPLGGGITIPAPAWTTLAPRLSIPSTNRDCVQVGSRVYLLGEYNSTNQLAAEVFDLATGEDRVLPDMPRRHVDSGMAAVDDDGRVYIFGGIYSGNGTMDGVDRYDPATDTWQSLAPMPGSRTRGNAFSANGLIYLVGGILGGNTTVAQVWAFDPATGQWTNKAAMPQPVSSKPGVYFEGKYYVFGGNSAATVDALQVYDVATDSWTVASASTGLGAVYGKAVAVSGRICLFGTIGGAKVAMEYDPRTGGFSKLPVAPSTYAPGLFSWDGTVYALGGSTPSGYTSNVYAYSHTRRGAYTSDALDAGKQNSWGRIGWTAFLPQDTTVTIQTRTSTDSVTWSDWSDEYSTGDAIDSPPGRYIQWQASMMSQNLRLQPVLGDVTVGLGEEAEATLTAPAPISPSNSVVFDPAPTFEWLNATGGLIRTYEAQVDVFPTFDSGIQMDFPALAETTTTSRFYLPSNRPLTDGVWFWRVRATDGNRVSEWSTPAPFVVATTPKLDVDVSAPATVTCGDTASVGVIATNNGAPSSAISVKLEAADGSWATPLTGSLGALDNAESAQTALYFETAGRAGQLDLIAHVSTDGFEADYPVTIEVLPPDIDVSVAPIDSSVAHDEEATFTATVTNSADVTQTVGVSLGISDAEGAEVEALPPTDIGELAPGEVRSVTATWSPAGIYAGEYRVRADAYNTSGPGGSATASFTVVPDVKVSARVGLDSIEYAAGEKVTATSRVTNGSANMVLSDATVRTSIVDSSGATLATDEQPIDDLMRGDSRVSRFAWDSSLAVPDIYHAVETVLLADGTQVASSEQTLTVKPTSATGDGLIVSMTSTPSTVFWSESATFSLWTANDGNSAIADVPVRISVVDPQTTGTVLWHAEAALSLSVGESSTVSVTCPTSALATTFAGEPRDLLVVAQAQFAEGLITLDHTVLHVTPLKVSAQLTADKPAYDCDEPVALTATASNDTTDFPLAGAIARVELTGPDGSVLTTDKPLAEIADGDSKSADVAWNTGISTPGTYTATVDVTYLGQTFAHAETTFQVVSTAHSGVGLSGVLAPAHADVQRGDPLVFSYTLADAGNADIAFMPVAVVLTDEAGQQVAEVTQTVSVTRIAAGMGAATFDTTELLASTATTSSAFSVALVATLPSGAKTLATASATVRPVPPTTEGGVAIDSQLAQGTRALVLAQSAADEQLAVRALSDAVCYRIVDDAAEFTAQMRTGVYNTFVVLDPVRPLPGHANRELAERVFSGATFIGSRGSGMDYFGRLEMLGLKFTGYTSACGSHTLAVEESARTPEVDATVTGKVRKTELRGASALARFGTLPAITYNSYGAGSAMYFAFDLASTDAGTGRALLTAAWKGCPSAEATPGCGDVVAVVTTLTNHEASAVDALVTASVANGTLLSASDRCDDDHDWHPGGCWPHAPRHHDAGGWRYHRIRWCSGAFDRRDEPGFGHDGRGPCTPPAPPTATWRLHLASGETTTVTSLVRLPWREGTMTFSATAKPQTGTAWPSVTSTLSVPATGDIDALYADAIAKVRALHPATRCDQRTRAAVLTTLTNLADWHPSRRSQCSGVLGMLLDCAERIGAIDADTTDAHLAIDEVIRNHQARSAL